MMRKNQNSLRLQQWATPMAVFGCAVLIAAVCALVV
jgi:hypothetical protein